MTTAEADAGRPAVLVVDDDERNLVALEALLEELDVDLVKAHSGREALQRLLERAFAAVLLDVHMPEMDGFETAELIRSASRTRHVPIIFLTANTDLERVATGYAKGAVDYLTKPIVPKILRAKVAVFIELYRAKERERQRAVEEERLRAQFEHERLVREQERVAALALAQANRRLEAALAQTRRALETRDEFLQMASHELKTPLTSLRLALDNGLRHASEEVPSAESKVQRTLRVMGSQIERLSALAEELLSVVLLQDDALRLNRTNAELGELVSAALYELGYSLEIAKCGVDVVADGRVEGRWDGFWLQRAIVNLLANALKFGAGKPIEVRVAADERRGIVTVRDHGIGIAAGEHERIFQAFERAVSSTNYAGLGLGLFIVRRVVEAHGGTVTVTSEPGAGATFTLALPRGPIDEPAAEVPRASAEF